MAGPAPETRPRTAWLRRLGFAFLVGAPGAAEASAWIAPQGDRSIVGAAYTETDEVSIIETDLHIEAPVGRRVSVVANHWAETVAGFEGSDTRVQSDLLVKYRLLRGERSVLSVQGGGVWDSRASGDCGEYGGDLRLLGGASTRRGHFFANAEGGVRVQGVDCVHAKYDLTLGWKPLNRAIFLAEIFADDDLSYGQSIKAQLSGVVFARDGRGLQLGARVRVDVDDVIEPTIIVRYWSALRR